MSDPSGPKDRPDPNALTAMDLVDEILKDTLSSLKSEQHKWTPTNGADLSGHDFGCEWIWLFFDFPKTRLRKPLLRKVGELTNWRHVLFYMLTDIKTPSPP